MSTNTYVALQTQVLSSSASSITFSSIPQTYTDLVLISNYSTSSNDQTIYAQMGNGSIDTGTNYSTTVLAGQGSGGLSARQSNTSIGVAVGGFYYGAGTTFPSTIQTHFINYSNGTTNKTILSRDATQRNDGNGEAGVFVGLWRSTSTSAINQIKIYPSAGNFNTGSTFTLYGIANADVGAYATGGIITQDANYYYHAFGNSGYFTPTRNLTADILVVAGGGGGGYNIGGGGGAGGLRAIASQSLSNGTSYTCTIGAGGAGGFNHTHAATGGNSSISGTGLTTITTDGGGGGGSRDVGSPYQYNGNSGGSGGGGANTDQSASPAGGAGNVGSYSPVEGYAGGIGYQNYNSPYFPAGGGGGAGGIGQDATSATTTGGYGGVGAYTYNSINFSPWLAAAGLGQNVSGTYYVAGGGGGGVNTGNNGSGGYGGGATAGSAGIASTGGGGGGGTATNSAGSAGGSGLILIRYAK